MQVIKETQPTLGLIAEFDEIIQDLATLSTAAEMLAKKAALKREDLNKMLEDLKAHNRHAMQAHGVVSDMIGYLEAGLPVEIEPERQAA